MSLFLYNPNSSNSGGGSGGADLSNYYTRSEINALLANVGEKKDSETRVFKSYLEFSNSGGFDKEFISIVLKDETKTPLGETHIYKYDGMNIVHIGKVETKNISSHDELNDIQGGSNGEYYHLTSSEKQNVEDIVDLKNEILDINDQINIASKKVITFLAFDVIEEGVLSAHIEFPFDGKIVELKAICSAVGVEDTLISIEKSSDMRNWIEVLSDRLVIKQDEFFDNEQYTLIDPIVNKGDIFRVNVEKSGKISNLTVSVGIEI